MKRKDKLNPPEGREIPSPFLPDYILTMEPQTTAGGNIFKIYHGFRFSLPANWEGTVKEEAIRDYYKEQRKYYEPNRSETADLVFIMAALRAAGEPIPNYTDEQLFGFLDAFDIDTFQIVTEGTGEPPYRFRVEIYNIDIKIYAVKIIYKSGKDEIKPVKDFLGLFISYFPEQKKKTAPNKTTLTDDLFTSIPLDLSSSLTAPGNTDTLFEITEVADSDLSDYLNCGIPLANGATLRVDAKDTAEARKVILSLTNHTNIAMFIALYKFSERDINGGRGNSVTGGNERRGFITTVRPYDVLKLCGYANPKLKYADFDKFISDFGKIKMETVLNKKEIRSIRLVNELESKQTTGKGGRRSKTVTLYLPDDQNFKIVALMIPDSVLRLYKDAPERARFGIALLHRRVQSKHYNEVSIKLKLSEIQEYYRLPKTEKHARQYKQQVKKALDQFRDLEIIKHWEIEQSGLYSVTFPDWSLYDNRKHAEREAVK